MSPVDRESRIAAQLAPLLMVDSMPYLRNKPFSCAMTNGEQSVSAMMPKRSRDISGLSASRMPGLLMGWMDGDPAGGPQAHKRLAPRKPPRLLWTNWRREIFPSRAFRFLWFLKYL